MPPTDNSPTAVLHRFYAAERRYMSAGGKASGADFSKMSSTMHSQAKLYQSPDLPWGGEYIGIEGFADWAVKMSDCFETVNVKDPIFAETGDRVIVSCTLETKARKTGETFERPMVQIVTVKEGRIVEFRPFYWCVPDYVAANEGRKVGQVEV